METLTYESVLKLINTQSKRYMENLNASQKKFELRLQKEEEQRKKEEEQQKKEEDKREEQQKKYAEQREERYRKFDARMDRIGRKIAKLTDSWSDFVEGIVRPNIIRLFEEHDIVFEGVYPNIIEERDRQMLYEIDLFVINSIYALAVEVKTKLTTDGVKKHLKRLQKIREQPPKHFKKGLEGKKLLGAVAGMKIEKNAAEFAIKNGLFVLAQKGESMVIINENNFKFRKWQI